MLETEGFDLVRGVVPPAMIEHLRGEASRLASVEPDAVQGIRDLLRKSEMVRECLATEWLKSLVPSGHACVRGILFDKTPGANWLVAWHQDLTICVQAKCEAAGYGPWSVKHGVPHVQPPTSLLKQMLTVRLHLDETRAANGALKVVPGSHLEGRLSAELIEPLIANEVICEAAPGDVLRMRPLLLHASSKAESPAHRRVVHLEFAPREVLASPLQWYEC